MTRYILRVALLSAALAPAAGAQLTNAMSMRPTLSLSAGVFEFDLSGTGAADMLAVRLDYPLRRFFLLEGSLSAARPAQQFGDTTTFVVAEGQFQAQAPLPYVSPYLGAGLGLFWDMRDEGDGGTVSDPTFSVSGGVRVRFTDRLGMRGELRVRGTGTRFVGGGAEWTAGVSWRL